ncbi:MAG: OmpA family protein [Alphaproteobacteria bacterium]|nr:OmpA family protein [Alphaproteobacteria bacterium]
METHLTQCPKYTPKKESPLWVITFVDMLSLLLSFFILLFSMCELKKKQLEHHFPQKFYPEKSQGSPIPEQGTAAFNIQPPPALNLNYLINVINAKIKDIPFLKQAIIIPFNDRVILSMPSELIFDTAKATLKKESQHALNLLAEGLRTIPNRVQIYGYSDPRPIKGGPYISNWELSLARALSVEKALLDGGYDHPILTQGFLDTNPFLLDELVKASKNKADSNLLLRRVDIALFESGSL